MEIGETPTFGLKKASLTPKALLNQKYGDKACYNTEEVQGTVGNDCPGLIIQNQAPRLFKCRLDLPEFSVTSDTFTRKKEAEQSAAKIAVDTLGIQPKTNNLTLQETWDELVSRLSYIFTNEFLSSSPPNPLIYHIRAAVQREGDLFGLVPVSILAACDSKLNNLCKSINLKAESNPSLITSLIMKAARSCGTICTSEGKFWIWKRNLYSSEVIQALIDKHSGSMENIQIEALHIPCSIEKPIETLTLDVASNAYYMDVIAQKLNVRDSSEVLLSRTVGKNSSEMRFYFSAREVPPLDLDSSPVVLSNGRESVNLERVINGRASYFSGQNIYGDAVLAVVGYTWRSADLFHEDVSLTTYYRLLLRRVPDGNYKLGRGAVLAAELPTLFTARANWRGPLPRELLCMFCRQHRLSEPVFSSISTTPSEPPSSNGIEHSGGQSAFRYEVRILSKGQDVMIEYHPDGSYRKQTDAIQNSALRVLTWLNIFFKHLDLNIPVGKISFGDVQNIRFYPQSLSREFAFCPSIHNVHNVRGSVLQKCSSLGSLGVGQSNLQQENGMVLLNIEDPDSCTVASNGSIICVSYIVSLVRDGEHLKEPLESNDEFEFEIGTGAVFHQLEACVTQMSVNQAARFITELPSKDLILAADGESAKLLSLVDLQACFLEYYVKVLRVTEPLEDRMEQALFSPPLSKQRVEFAVRHIKESHALTLVDFGCGSGSLLDSLLNHDTALEKIVGVDISRKGLTRAAKILHSKLSVISDPVMQSTSIRSAVLYDGSITDFDSRLYGFDIGTCLEVIEHMEEDDASLFGEVVLSSFCPRMLIVSTPNYEYNSILQRTNLSSREEDPDEKNQTTLPCKFRNYDHKFEWTREQFNCWASNLASRHNYSVEFDGVGGMAGVDPGFASQIAVFKRDALHQGETCLQNEDSSNHHYEVIWEWNNMSRSAL